MTMIFGPVNPAIPAMQDGARGCYGQPKLACQPIIASAARPWFPSPCPLSQRERGKRRENQIFNLACALW